LHATSIYFSGFVLVPETQKAVLEIFYKINKATTTFLTPISLLRYVKKLIIEILLQILAF